MPSYVTATKIAVFVDHNTELKKQTYNTLQTTEKKLLKLLLE